MLGVRVPLRAPPRRTCRSSSREPRSWAPSSSTTRSPMRRWESSAIAPMCGVRTTLGSAPRARCPPRPRARGRRAPRPGPRSPSVSSVVERLLVHHAAASHVHEEGAGASSAPAPAASTMWWVPSSERHVQGQRKSAGDHLVESREPSRRAAPGAPPRRCDGPVSRSRARVMPHAAPVSPDAPPMLPGADDHRASCPAAAGRRARAWASGPGGRRRSARATLRASASSRREGELGDRGRGAGDADEADAAGVGMGDVDVVQAGAGADQELQVRGCVEEVGGDDDAAAEDHDLAVRHELVELLVRRCSPGPVMVLSRADRVGMDRNWTGGSAVAPP